jgi:hypothetical protein
MFFTQVYCKIPTTEEMDDRKYLQFILVWTIILSALIYFFGLEWYDYYSDKNLKSYDKSTTTGSDFTVEYVLPKGMFENFKKNIYSQFLIDHKKQNDKDLTHLAAFNQYLINGIEHVLNRDSEEEPEEELKSRDTKVLDDILANPRSYERSNDQISSRKFATLPKNEYNIADVNYTFDNRELLRLLKHRGEAVENKDINNINNYEKDINNIISEKHTKLTKPLSAFITFETEKGYLKACKMNLKKILTNKVSKLYWGEYPLYFKPAKEPDTIVWENYGVSQKEKC